MVFRWISDVSIVTVFSGPVSATAVGAKKNTFKPKPMMTAAG